MGFSQQTVEDLLVKAARCCCLCHQFKGTKLEVHHIIVKADGGTDDPDNGIPLCFDCHSDVHAYASGPPRGRRFTPSELKRHRDNWFATVAAGQVQVVRGRAIQVFTSKLPITGPDLFGRDRELEILDKAWEDQKTNVVSFVAWGGVGKTALVNTWLHQRMSPDGWRGAERVFGWSFYSQGIMERRQVSADEFIAFALNWFGDPDPTLGTPWEKGDRLAELVRKQRTLLILDGLEPLQNPPGPEEGHIKDPALKCLIRELASSNPGLCVITTRCKVEDIADHTEPQAITVELEHLSDDAGAQLLGKLGVKGTSDELKQISREFGGHALALTLLGNYLAVVHHGDIRKRSEIGPLAHEQKEGGHARRVMESYENWFEERPELDILRIMGLFNRPAPAGAIAALRADPPIRGITTKLEGLTREEWRFALANLRRAGLLDQEDPENPNDLDCHPLIREHFGEKLKKANPAGWKEAHSRLYEYYKSVPEKEFPDTLEEMVPLFAAVAHGCEAGRHQEAFEQVYWARIHRGKEFYSSKKLGAFGAELSALSGFFDEPWVKPVPGLREASQAFVLTETGFDLRALGRLEEAAVPMKAGQEINIALRDWNNAAIQAGNLSELYLSIGDVAKAVDYAKKSVEHADRSGKWERRMINRTTLADALHQAGRLSEAEELFREAEEIQKNEQPEHPLLYSLRGFHYCDLLLEQGKHDEVRSRAEKAIEIAQRNRWLLGIALDHLSLGRACLLAAREAGSGDFSEAAAHLNKAVEGLREAGQQDDLPRGLLARAELYRIQGDFKKARRDLEEATRIAERGKMGLHQADCHLEYTWLFLAEGKKKQARKHLETAREMIGRMGYHRRDREVRELEGMV